MRGPAVDVLLVVSNGHGEDAIGARLAREVLARGGARHVAAIPLVGEGRAYESAGAEVLGPRARLPSDGLTLHHPSLAWRDLRAGLAGVTLRQARELRRGRCDGVLVVGDVYAQAMATLVRAPRVVVQPLVSVRLSEGGGSVALNRTFMERIRAPERTLMRRAAVRVYTRDDATATWLHARGVRHALFLGNPVMDGLEGRPLATPPGKPVVALLPGSRAYARASVSRMLAGVAALGRVHALVAWTHEALAPADGWRLEGTPAADGTVAWRRDETTVWWVRERFADVLASASAVLGTTGTAQEQAAGLGLPVVSFAVAPAYSEAFLANQRRLLGGALRIVPGDAGAIAQALRAALCPGEHREAAGRLGPERMGPPGGTARIAEDAIDTLVRQRVSRPRS